MFYGRDESLCWIFEMFGVVGNVLNGLCFGPHGSWRGCVGVRLTMTSTTIDPVADGVGIASVVPAALMVAVVACLPIIIGRTVMIMGIVSETRAHAGGYCGSTVYYFDSAVMTTG